MTAVLKLFLATLVLCPLSVLALEAARVSDVKAALEVPVDARRLNMTIGVVGTPTGITFQHAYGFMDLSGETPARVDSIVAIASMTKLVTTVAALQLHEAGDLDLDAQVDTYLPALSTIQILVGFDNNAAPIFRTPNRRPTIRELMSHTSGFVYSMWNQNAQIAEDQGITGDFTTELEMINNAPLASEPGTRWEYGISTDWLGVIVEEVSGQSLARYFESNIFSKLQMADTFYEIPEDKLDRTAHILSRDSANLVLRFLSLFTPGDLVEIPFFSSPSAAPKFSSEHYSGGGNLYASLPDYATLLQALLAGGEINGARILQKKTVDQMFENQTADLSVGDAKSQNPVFTNDITMGFGAPAQFGLGLLLHPQGTPNGRSPGSGSWAGLFNTYFWIDPKQQRFGIFATQVLPFFDDASIQGLGAFERAVYGIEQSPPEAATRKAAD